ncbi:MAG: rhodoquinone biosynthesis methyltransferase RquA [Rhodospirillaceae bacterium]
MSVENITSAVAGGDQVELMAGRAAAEGLVPKYLREVYTWAYLDPLALAVFDHRPIVSAILWGNYGRLFRAVKAEVREGDRAMQLAAVYGPFSPDLMTALGPTGSLDLIEVAPIQVEMTRNKLKGHKNARVLLCDATTPPPGQYDLVISFFLIHEVPEDYKARIVEGALSRLKPGGRAVFVDYHRPARWHPLRPVMTKVFDWLEPFAKALWTKEIFSYAGAGFPDIVWRKQTYFGGLYQKLVAERRP